MTDDDERTINALENALSKRIDDARRAQANLTAARRRLGLFDPQQIFSADDMDAERAASLVELREIVAAVIAEARLRYDASYRPDAQHRAWIEIAASFGKEAVANNVVALESAREIIKAGRRRRAET